MGEIDLVDDEGYRQGFPHDVFTRLRREAPVYGHDVPDDYAPTPGEGFWVLSDHHDIQAANRDTELLSAFDGPALQRAEEQRGKILVRMDGRAHTRLRRLVRAGFTPRMVGTLEQKARAWAVSILDAPLELAPATSYGRSPTSSPCT